MLQVAAQRLEQALEAVATAPAESIEDVAIKLRWIIGAYAGDETSFEPEFARTALEGVKRLARVI